MPLDVVEGAMPTDLCFLFVVGVFGIVLLHGAACETLLFAVCGRFFFSLFLTDFLVVAPPTDLIESESLTVDLALSQ